MVAVGATCVGKVKINFDTLETNVAGSSRTTRVYDEGKRPRLVKGGEDFLVHRSIIGLRTQASEPVKN